MTHDDMAAPAAGPQPDGAEWKARHDALKAEFDAFRAATAEKERLSAVSAAYRGLLRDSGIDGRRADAVMRVTDLSGMALDEEGHLRDEARLKAGIMEAWGDFVATTRTQGAPVASPPRAEPAEDAFARGFDAV